MTVNEEDADAIDRVAKFCALWATRPDVPEIIYGYEDHWLTGADLLTLIAELRTLRASIGPDSDLLLHIVSAHCNGAGLNLSSDEATEHHEHEHDGPCTIRDHPRESRDWDGGKVAEVLAECLEMDRPAGPDSERIRELEAENARQRAWITDVLTRRVCGARHPTLPEVGPCSTYAYAHPDPVDKHHGVDGAGAPWSWPLEAETPALRAAGLSGLQLR